MRSHHGGDVTHQNMHIGRYDSVSQVPGTTASHTHHEFCPVVCPLVRIIIEILLKERQMNYGDSK